MMMAPRVPIQGYLYKRGSGHLLTRVHTTRSDAFRGNIYRIPNIMQLIRALPILLLNLTLQFILSDDQCFQVAQLCQLHRNNTCGQQILLNLALPLRS